MATLGKGITKIDIQISDWSEDDREDLMEFVRSAANGVTSVMIYLHQRGVKVSLSATHRWVHSVRRESDRVARMRRVFDDYQGLTADEINAYVAATMAEIIVSLQADIKDTGLDLKKIQALTSLAKEARTSAQAMNTPHSSASIKEMELGFAMSFADKLESIFEGDDVLLERIRNACKAIIVEIEGQYQN